MGTQVKPVVKTSTMEQELQDEVIAVAQVAMSTETNEQEIAAKVKQHFEQKYHGLLWHCCVGRNVACYVTHEQSKFLYFYIGQMAVGLCARNRGFPMSLKLYAEIPYKLVRKRSHGPVLSTPPPLPLIALSPDDEWEEFDTATQTGFGYALPYLPALDEPDAHKHAERGSVAVPPEAPRRSRLLSEYMTNNEFFQSPRHGFGTETRLIYKRNKELESGSIALIASMNRPDEVSFGATFESRNLDRAYRVLGRRYAPSHDLLMLRSSKSSSDSKKATKPLNDPVVASASKVPSSQTPFPFFVDVDSEYDLYADTDVNTHGHVQWYFFRVTVPSTLLRQTRERGATNLKVRFNIRNMLKKASLYTDGMLPAVYIERPGPVKKHNCKLHQIVAFDSTSISLSS
ncbi:hypothetical protein PR001_g5807 [Phytophthora rubi]|uniref:Dynein light chain 1, cytoplasmic n=1 Tax=Phytophthora rubi TaxID=129364 RepID=A0A6A3NJH4_9STRA|nr:hypothetical protein PR001_g5807 [Phytophthora rubi]